MGKRLDFVTAAAALGVAAYVAIMMDCVAHGQLGWSNGQIRGTALLAAACLALGLAVDFLDRQWRKAGQR
jgi:hypothetical protein